MASTHFVAVKRGIVVGTRTSASRHVGGSGKFGPYTHAILRTERTTMLATGESTEDTSVISWHGGIKNAVAGLRAANVGHSWTMDYEYRLRSEHYTRTYLDAEIIEVFVVTRKPKVGDRLFPAIPNPDAIPGLEDASPGTPGTVIE